MVVPGASEGSYFSAGNPVGPTSSVILATMPVGSVDTVSRSRSGSMSLASTSIVIARSDPRLDLVGAGYRRLVGAAGREQLHVDRCDVGFAVLVDDRVVERVGAAEAWLRHVCDRRRAEHVGRAMARPS